MKRFMPLMLAAGLMASTAWADTTLRFATWDSNEALDIQKQIAAMFEAAHPGVKVQIEAYGDGYDDKIAAGFGAGDPPDVMYMWNYPAYQASLLPLNDYLAASKMDMTDFAASTLPYATIKDADGTSRSLGHSGGLYDARDLLQQGHV